MQAKLEIMFSTWVVQDAIVRVSQKGDQIEIDQCLTKNYREQAALADYAIPTPPRLYKR